MRQNRRTAADFNPVPWHSNKPGFVGMLKRRPCVGFLFRCYSDPKTSHPEQSSEQAIVQSAPNGGAAVLNEIGVTMQRCRPLDG